MTATAATSQYNLPNAGVSYSGDRKQETVEIMRQLPKHMDAAIHQYADGGFDHHYRKLRALTKDSALIPDGAESPSTRAQTWALIMLRQLQADRIAPTRIVASAEGGVAICFVSGDKYADVEFLNTGEILGVLSNRRDPPTVWPIEQSSRDFTRTAFRISQFLNASTSSQDAAKRARNR